jgi:aromatic-L-amino-acid/L-tryptophan decarboxylase
MRADVLRRCIIRDRAAGLRPFLVVGTAGTVDTGAVDDLAALADVAAQASLWFHVDGAFGAAALLAPALRPLLAGIERADSVAFDFHKWLQVPYDAGCVVVRDAACLIATFGTEAAYLRREQRGLAGGEIWPCDLGPDLSRGFRALKVWMTLRTHGADALGQVVQRSCGLAAALAARVEREPALELLAPVMLNIVCFRYRATSGDLDRLNGAIVSDLQEAGIAAPSTTTVNGVLAIRAALVNHRTIQDDIDIMRDAVLRLGRLRAGAADKKMPPVMHRGQVNREASRLGDAGANDPLPATGAGTRAASLQ